MELEVLAPAGSPKALEAAFAAGADAVYLALGQFGARAYAVNFSLDQARKVIEQAHLAGKKVYVTMNTLIEEEEMEAAYQQAKALHELGVDALIIQDLGLIHLLHHRLPGLELHASTQLSVSTPEQIEQLKKLGVTRAVLAREAALDEIRACAKTGMELEVFVHGALCISYSGQCRFSEVRYDRSANKGRCAQACRMEYTLEENGKPVQTMGRYLLSPRDLSILEQIPQLKKAGVLSLKIEGRMKSPEYVYESTAAARRAADGFRIGADLKDGMQIAFNRGYSKGHISQATGNDLMNTQTSNHQGIHLGKVLSMNRDRAAVRLDHDLHQNDGLRFVREGQSAGGNANFIFDSKGKLISKAKKGQTVEIQVPKGVYSGMEVRLTQSFELQKKVEDEIRTTKIQAPITMKLTASQIGEPVVLKASDGVHEVSDQGAALEKASKVPTSKEQIEKSLRKTGDTWARVEKIDLDLDPQAFLPASMLNTLRRSVIDKLTEVRLSRKPVVEQSYDFHPEKPEALPSYAQVSLRDQIMDDALMNVSEFPFKDTAGKSPIYRDEGEINDSLGKGRIVANLNLTNSYAAAALLEMGYQGGVLSPELSDSGRRAMMEAFRNRYGFEAPVIQTVYEKPRLMVMKHCPVNTAIKDGKRNNCSLCRTNRYTLRGKDGRRAVLMGNVDCRMQIFDETPIDQISRIPEFEEEGIHAFNAIFSDENREQTEVIRRQISEQLAASKAAAA